MTYTTLIIFFAVCVLVALATPLAKLSKIPVAVVEIILGACFGALATGFEADIKSIQGVSEVGLLFLMFLCGMEVDLKRFFALERALLQLGAVYFALLYALSALLVLVFGLPSIFIAIFPVMSLGMIMALIREQKRRVVWLDAALKVGILGELLSIAALTIFEGLYKNGASLELVQDLGILAAFLICTLILFKVASVLFWWYPNLKLLLLPKDEGDSHDLRFVLMLVILFILLPSVLGLERVLGAFVAGVILKTFFKYKQNLGEKLNEIGFGFFVPFFFIFVGMTIDLREIFANAMIVLNALCIVAAMFAVRYLAGFAVFFKYFGNAKGTMFFVLCNCMPLTFLVIFSSLGHRFGVLDEGIYTSCILAATFQGVFFSILIKRKGLK